MQTMETITQQLTHVQCIYVSKGDDKNMLHWTVVFTLCILQTCRQVSYPSLLVSKINMFRSFGSIYCCSNPMLKSN